MSPKSLALQSIRSITSSKGSSPSFLVLLLPSKRFEANPDGTGSRTSGMANAYFLGDRLWLLPRFNSCNNLLMLRSRFFLRSLSVVPRGMYLDSSSCITEKMIHRLADPVPRSRTTTSDSRAKMDTDRSSPWLLRSLLVDVAAVVGRKASGRSHVRITRLLMWLSWSPLPRSAHMKRVECAVAVSFDTWRGALQSPYLIGSPGRPQR